jgi:hypothetical protein
MSDFSKERFLGGKLTPTSIFRRIGEVWESQNAVVPDRVLNRTDVPPYMSDLLIWTDGKTYDPTTHQIKSRISPQYNLTLKQGLCIKGNNSDSFAVAPTPITGFPFTYACKIKITDITNAKGLLDLANSSDIAENWGLYKNGSALAMFIRKGGTNYETGNVLTGVFTKGSTYRIVIEYLNNTTVNIYINTVASVNVALIDVLPLPNPSDVNRFGIMALVDSTPGYFGNDIMHWACQFNRALTTAEKTEILDNDNPFGVTWASATDSFYAFNGNMYDLVSNRHMTNNSISLTERCNNSTFYCDEYGFAVKSGAIHPKLLDGTGYAGLVGEPDAVYQGLIAQTGKIEVKGQSYFDTLFSFTQNPNTEIEDAGIIIHGAGAMNGENCNSNNILTAETSLNTSYPNALTASVLNTESIQVFNGTNNANQRVFVKVTNPVYKVDNSSLLESGTITDILVYKRDLTPDEQVRVMLWCHNLDFLSVDLVKVGAEYLFVDDNIVYVCKV